MADNLPIRIIGLGSLHGDDQFGWQAAAHLRGSLSLLDKFAQQVDVTVCASPFDGFLELAERSRALILLDAVVSGSRPGTVMRIEEETLPEIRAPYSVHGYSVMQMIELGRVMNMLPKHVILLGVEVVDCAPFTPMEDQLHRVLERVEELVIEEIEFISMIG